MLQGRIIQEDQSTLDPNLNLALEQSILSNSHNSKFPFTIRFWKNNPCVIVGRNQDVFKEVNLNYCKINRITVCRRISGGGTVYQDQGNLNISIFIKKVLIPKQYSNIKEITQFFTELVIQSLKDSGLEFLSLWETSNILFKDYKISGSAGYFQSDYALHHLTLLLNSNLEHLTQSLLARPGYLIGKKRASKYHKTGNLPKHFELSNWKGFFISLLEKTFMINTKEGNILEKENSSAEILVKQLYSKNDWLLNQKRLDIQSFQDNNL